MSVPTRARGVAIAAGLLAMSVLSGCGSDAPSVSSGSATSPAQGTGSTPTSPGEPSSAAPSSPSSASSASSPASSTVGGSRSDLVKLCGPSEADTTRKTCKSAPAELSGNLLYCSAELPSSVQGSVKATLYRNGAPVFEGSTNRSAATGSLLLNFSVGKLQLGGGDYACKFTAGGQSWVGEAKVSGPQERASQGMACDSSTMFTKEQVTHCTSNTKALSNPSGLGCSALLNDIMGRKIDATLTTPKGSKDIPLSSDFPTGSAVVHLKAPKSAFTGGTFPKGDYSCDFKVDGASVISVPFSVS